MICNKCGNKSDDDSVYCSKCGAKFDYPEIQKPDKTKTKIKKPKIQNVNPVIPKKGMRTSSKIAIIVGISFVVLFGLAFLGSISNEQPSKPTGQQQSQATLQQQLQPEPEPTCASGYVLKNGICVIGDQLRLEKEKNEIRLKAESFPVVKGWMTGELSYYVNTLPSYASQNVQKNVENLASWMDGTYVNGVKLKRVYSGYADFSINWVKDYQEEAIGRQVGDHLIVGLGMGNCFGEWKPFDGSTVYDIMWHEVGHVMGYGHVGDKNSIMYEGGTGTRFQYDYSDTIILSDGYKRSIPFCTGGSVYFTTERVSSTDGYKVYVIPPGSNQWDAINGDAPFYLDCSAYENKMKSFSSSCNVAEGSSLVLYNPSIFGAGSDLQIEIQIVNTNPAPDKDLAFVSGSGYFSQAYIDHVKELFR